MTTTHSTPWGIRRMRPFPENALLTDSRIELDPVTQTGRRLDADGSKAPVLDRHKRSETSKETSTRTSSDGNSDTGSDQEGDSD